MNNTIPFHSATHAPQITVDVIEHMYMAAEQDVV